MGRAWPESRGLGVVYKRQVKERIFFRIVRCSAHRQKTLKVAVGAGQKMNKAEVVVSVHEPIMECDGQLFVSSCPLRHAPVVVLA